MQCDDKKTDMRTFAAEPEDIGTRIDVFAAENSDALSRSGFKKLIEEGNVLVNDTICKMLLYDKLYHTLTSSTSKKSLQSFDLGVILCLYEITL